MKTKKKTDPLVLVECAMLIAVAVVLELIPKFAGFELPFGGTITIMSLLPIALASYRNGLKWGFITAFVYSLMEMILGAKTIAGLFMPGDEYRVLWKALLICFIDYILAFTVLGIGGIFRKIIKKPALALVLGTATAIALCYFCHVLSGALFYGAWAEWYFTQDAFTKIFGTFGEKILTTFSGAGLAWVYSAFYNATYMLPELVSSVIGAAVVGSIPVLVKKNRKA